MNETDPLADCCTRWERERKCERRLFFIVFAALVAFWWLQLERADRMEGQLNDVCEAFWRLREHAVGASGQFDLAQLTAEIQAAKWLDEKLLLSAAAEHCRSAGE